jgi:error-prone DNA polymerase
VIEDYDSTGLSLRAHPLALLRPRLRALRVIANERLGGLEDGVHLKVSGLVLVRQRPGTASGVIFMTLEDETGTANIVVWAKIFERFRRAVIAGRCLKVTGRVQRDGEVVHVVAETIEDVSALLAGAVPKGAVLAALDERGRELNSPAFAALLRRTAADRAPGINTFFGRLP